MASLNLPAPATLDECLGPDRTNAGPIWDDWVERLENYLIALGIDNDAQKRAILLHMCGPSTHRDFKTLTDTGNDYKTAKTKLQEHFRPQVNVEYEKAKFRSMRQLAGESLAAYHTRLKQQATNCQFANGTLDNELKSHIIQTTTDNKLRRKGLRETLTLTQVLTEGRNNELSDLQGREMESSLGVRNEDKTVQKVVHKKSGERSSTNERPKTGSLCRKCNLGTFPHPGGWESCPAFGKKCNRCGKANHFASVCQGQGQSTGRGRGRGNSRGRRGRKTVNEVQGPGRSEITNDSENNDFVEYVFAVDVKDVNVIGDDCPQKVQIDHDVQKRDMQNNVVNCKSVCNDVNVQKHAFAVNKGEQVKPPKYEIAFQKNATIVMTADSAASCNLVDEQTYDEYLKHIPLEKARVRDTKVFGYGGSKIVTIGYFYDTVTIRDKSHRDVFFVVRGQSGCLLGLKASLKLGLLKLASYTCNAIEVEKYPSVFKGIGMLKSKEINLHIDECIPPVAQRHRRVPFQQRKMVEKEIHELLDNDIIEKATGPTPWVSPIVVVPKPKRPGEVRICVDMREPNRAIMRERHPSPTIDDIVERVNGAKIFSKIDLKSGYHQLKLAENSRYITTFSTHIGLFRYKRLNFGISSASEVFQKVVEDVISGIDGALNISDDIFVFGKGENAIAEHDKALDKTLSRLEEHGLTANLQKCVFRKKDMEFYGMFFTENGVAPDFKKIEALVKMAAPSNVGEVQSLLGMTNYLARFIPRYSTITAPLRKLTVKNADFTWGSQQQEAFEKLKNVLSEAPIVAFFDVKKETELIVDASPVGLGAVLVQYDGNDKNRKPHVVAYGSRSLTSVEMRYKSQLEREALAIIWACEYFHVYIYGSPIKVITDHQPLVTLFGSHRAKLPLRLERWALRLLPYQPTVVYRKGKDNPSDYMSRHPINSTESNRELLVAEEYVNFTASHAIPKAMTASEVVDATKVDATLSAVKDLLLTGQWAMMKTKYSADPSVDYEALQAYSKVGNELTVTEEGLVVKGHKIAIPEQLQSHVIQLAHEGHQGVVKTKSLLREKVWFPHIDRMVEEALQGCVACKATYDPKQREPLIMTELPTRKWSCLAADFFGPLPSGDHLLVVVDEYSRFPEVEIIRSLSAETVIPLFDKIFASRGTPDRLKTDNGTPFQSEEFKRFSEQLGFKHQKITPYWPEANGVAERFMRNIGKACKCAQIQGRPWKQELYLYLRNYRATPHSSTGVSPATVLNGEPLKTKLPQMARAGVDESLRERDFSAKLNMKSYAEGRRNICHSDINVGDVVLMKNVTRQGKLVPKFQPNPFEVVEKKGSMIVAQRGDEVKARNSSHFRKVDARPEHFDTPIDLASYRNVSPSERTDPMPPQTPCTTPEQEVAPDTVVSLDPVASPKSPKVCNPPVRPTRNRTIPKKYADFDVKLPGVIK